MCTFLSERKIPESMNIQLSIPEHKPLDTLCKHFILLLATRGFKDNSLSYESFVSDSF